MYHINKEPLIRLSLYSSLASSKQMQSLANQKRSSKIIMQNLDRDKSLKKTSKNRYKNKSPAHTQKIQIGRSKTRLQASPNYKKKSRPKSQLKVKSNHKEISYLLKSTRLKQQFDSNKFIEVSNSKSPKRKGIQTPHRKQRLSQLSFSNKMSKCDNSSKEKDKKTAKTDLKPKIIERDFKDLRSWLPGDIILSRFQTQQILGKGAFGQVFRAYDKKRRRGVAIKIVQFDGQTQQTAMCQVLMLEFLSKQKGVGQSNIVVMKQFYKTSIHLFLIFQVLACNILKLISTQRVDSLFARRVAIQLLNGLNFLSKCQVIHCDLKPQNILLTDKESTGIKIIDLGSSCYHRQKNQYFSANQYIQSRYYRAPQVLIGAQISYSSDMWSFGCIIAELILGRPLFLGQSSDDQVGAIAQVLGKISPNFLYRCRLGNKYFDQGGTFKPAINNRGCIRKSGIYPLERIFYDSDLLFIDFLKGILRWEPQLRFSPSEALKHQWIVNHNPDQLRELHSTFIQNAQAELQIKRRGQSRKKYKRR